MSRSRAKVRTADMDSAAYAELGTLMREFPDWSKEFPELHAELNPIRYFPMTSFAVWLGNIDGQKYRNSPD